MPWLRQANSPSQRFPSELPHGMGPAAERPAPRRGAARFDVRRPLGLSLLIVVLVSQAAMAAQFRLPSPKAKTIGLPGAFGGLKDPATGEFYTADPFGLGDEFSFPVLLDSGASGTLLTNITAGSSLGLNLPLTGETFTDVGIGGDETFDVSEPTQLWLANVNVGALGADVESNYEPFGQFKFQVAQPDSTLPIDVIGQPVLSQHVMHVQPNELPETILLLTAIIDILQTSLIPEVPSNLPAHRTLRVPIEYRDFIDDPNPPVDVSDNPVVPGVKIVDARQPPDQQSDPRDLVFDSGGSITLFGRDFAIDIGIDLENETPVDQVEVGGAGGDTRLLFGYEVDEMILPLFDGDELVLENTVIFVPEEGALPADIPGIVGMNLFSQAFSETVLGLPVDIMPSLFSDWYLDPFGSQLVLVQQVPEPGTSALLALGLAWLLAFRRSDRTAG